MVLMSLPFTPFPTGVAPVYLPVTPCALSRVYSVFSPNELSVDSGRVGGGGGGGRHRGRSK